MKRIRRYAPFVPAFLLCSASIAAPLGMAQTVADADRRDPGALDLFDSASPERIESLTTRIEYTGLAQNGPMEPRSYDACIAANRSYCLFTQYSLVNIDGTHSPYFFSNYPSDGYSQISATPSIKSLVINSDSRRLKIFSEPYFKGKCRIMGTHKSPYPSVYDSTPFQVYSAKAIAGDVTPTPDCPKY